MVESGRVKGARQKMVVGDKGEVAPLAGHGGGAAETPTRRPELRPVHPSLNVYTSTMFAAFSGPFVSSASSVSLCIC